MSAAGVASGLVGEQIERFPLFPLGLVLLPSETVPLHIFEERYKTMIGECLDEGTPFGIVWLSEDGLKEIGCTAEVTRLIERLEDGRMNVLVEGAQAFRLLRRIEDMPYPAGDIELLEERAAPADEQAEGDARERYADLVERATDSRPEEGDLEGLDAYGMAASIDFAPGSKQDLLELRSEPERLRRLLEMLTATLKRLDYAERAQELSRSNGKVRY
jgi:Lon protease-like protein